MFGHVMRSDESRPLRQITMEAMERSQMHKCGRPRATWIHSVKQDLRSTDIGIYTAAQIARSSRNKYRDRIVLNRKI